jgi:hypothetical protein
MRRIVIAALLLGPGLAAAQSGLALQEGFYVFADTPCGQASRASVVRVDRQGISDGRGTCRITQQQRDGDGLRIVQRCSDPFDDSTFTQRLRIVLHGERAFSMFTPAGEFRFRHCPQSSMPEPWRTAR